MRRPRGDGALVSVVVPVHNREDVVAETLSSVAAQHYRPIELVIVDDGSTDASLDVIRRWATAHAGEQSFRIVVLTQQNRGVQRARNVGIAASAGAFIQFLGLRRPPRP